MNDKSKTLKKKTAKTEDRSSAEIKLLLERSPRFQAAMAHLGRAWGNNNAAAAGDKDKASKKAKK